ncbi:cardiolipin synthase ClsB [Undibacterium crateris]|uniref:cardiolipin synthase ClsB n=1 Tax=Undibacterium crateris TaxID=2528175 RepID=UPI0013895439|nr:cardiolipin synthase ClsB [Undibacterium crateris]NDI86441.1 cardiolipin synthase ClsB [Undibacterium crateris]
MSKLTFIDGNDVRLLRSGKEFFPELLGAIHAAQQEIYLETYIFTADPTANQVRDALMAAARRGVTVRVVIDWLGSGRAAAETLVAELCAAGVAARCFNPWFRRGLARTHRKILVADRAVALLGGLNIIDDLVSDDGWDLPLPYPRWDFAVSLRGPLVNLVFHEVDAQWRRTGKLNLRARFALMRDLHQEAKVARTRLSPAALLVRDNLRNRSTIQKAYLQALGQARQRAILVTPYFAPGRKFRRALTAAASRGVQVTLVVGVGQFALQDAVAQSYYPSLLRQGVRIIEYHKTQLHAKVAIVDDDWATVGSSNFDALSLFLNHEANIVIQDAEFTAELEAELNQGIADGTEVQEADFSSLPWTRKLWNGFAFLVYRNLMRIMTSGHYG